MVATPLLVVVVMVVVVASSGVVRGVGTVHGPVGIGCGQRVAGWMGIDQPGGQQDAFAGYLLYPLHHQRAPSYTLPGFRVTYTVSNTNETITYAIQHQRDRHVYQSTPMKPLYIPANTNENIAHTDDGPT